MNVFETRLGDVRAGVVTEQGDFRCGFTVAHVMSLRVPSLDNGTFAFEAGGPSAVKTCEACGGVIGCIWHCPDSPSPLTLSPRPPGEGDSSDAYDASRNDGPNYCNIVNPVFAIPLCWGDVDVPLPRHLPRSRGWGPPGPQPTRCGPVDAYVVTLGTTRARPSWNCLGLPRAGPS